MKKLICLFVVLTSMTLLLQGQEEMRLLRFPAIHGNTVVFSYGGDLYTVSTDGGIARKLTSDPGYEMFPRFSPDGKKIAFTGQYDGNTEIYVIPATGGKPERITYTATLTRDDISDRMGPNNIAMTWTPDGKSIVYRSRGNSFNDFVGQLYQVPAAGGLSKQLPLSTGGFCSYSKDGSKLAFNRVFREFRTWKYYQGGMADDIRIYDTKTHQIEKITDHKAQDIFPMWYDQKIFFLSDRDRTMNLFVYDLQTKTTQKITNYTDYDIKFPSLGGAKIIFEKGGYLYTYDIPTGTTAKISVIIADDLYPGKSVRTDASKNIQNVELSPDGNRLVTSARGDIFTIPAEHGFARNLTQSSGHHDRDAVWSPDGQYIAFISDITGENEVYIQVQDGSSPPVQLTKNTKTYIYNLEWSPNSKKILFNDKLFRLQCVDIETKKTKLITTNKVWEYTQFHWSPDSKWITWVEPKKSGMNMIMLYNTEEGKSYPVTDEWYSCNAPRFSDDGKYLSFVSMRDFSPIYSQTEWNHAYRNMARIYLVLLSKDTPNPFAEKNDETTITTTSETKDKKESGSDKDAATKDTPENTTVIDMDGLTNRIIALPLRPSGYFNIHVLGNKVYYNEFYFGEKGFNLSMYNLDKQEETPLGENMGYSISTNGKKMLISSKGSYYVIDLPQGKIKPEKSVDMKNMVANTTLLEEWQQIYTESWRQMRDFFYAKNMHGVDWKAMHDKYAVMIPYVSNRNDLNYLIGELIGELNVGHAYVSGGDKYELQRIFTGMLGASLEKGDQGYFRITEIMKGQNWNKNLISPLTLPGLNIREGDYIIAIDGQSTKDIADPYTLLTGKADKAVELTISPNTNGSDSRKVIIRPIRNESELEYFNWVQQNIQKVNEATNGEVGYLHIPDMVTTGLNEFVKYYYPQLTKKALIIDGRGNGGGNVSPMIIERLRREVIRIGAPRNVEEYSTTPNGMMTGPMVLLINQYSASDGDLFPYAFKKLGLGTVIGVRSWGGVIGIRGSLPFIDGGSLNKPEFGTFSSKTGEWIIEGHGVDPDIVIDNDPYREYTGIDDQLNKAIEVITEQLKDAWEMPEKPADPNRSK